CWSTWPRPRSSPVRAPVPRPMSDMSEGSNTAMTSATAAPAPGHPYVDAATGQVMVRPSALTAADAGSLAGAAAGALGLVWLLYERILPFSGALGFWLCWYVAFLAL